MAFTGDQFQLREMTLEKYTDKMMRLIEREGPRLWLTVNKDKIPALVQKLTQNFPELEEMTIDETNWKRLRDEIQGALDVEHCKLPTDKDIAKFFDKKIVRIQPDYKKMDNEDKCKFDRFVGSSIKNSTMPHFRKNQDHGYTSYNLEASDVTAFFVMDRETENSYIYQHTDKIRGVQVSDIE